MTNKHILIPSKLEPFIPIWNRGKNSLIKYEVRHFDDGVGNTAQITYALFLDKNKEEQEMVAYIKWDKL
jgi:hypothetical protein